MKKSLQYRRERNRLTCIERLEARIAPATFTVTTTNDSGAGSLRKAMQDANAAAGPDMIVFNIAPSGPQTIDVLSALPVINDPLEIRGSSQPGIPANTPGIQLDGSGAGDVNGIEVVAGDSKVEGLVISNFDRFGIFIHEKGNNLVDNCCIGVEHGGETAAPNKLGGVLISNVADNTVQFSILSGNGGTGVTITGEDAMNNVVQFTQIGLDRPGTHAIPNDLSGVLITRRASANRVDNCFISGNDGDGVRIQNEAHDNVVTLSRIGTDISGTAAVPNMGRGVVILDSNSNTIGGGPGGNLISGNGEDGIEITRLESSPTGNKILGNTIGLNVNGSQPLPNGGDGILVSNAPETLIGGGMGSDRNVISANDGNGIRLSGKLSRDAVVQGNYIGTDKNGTRPGTQSLGNQEDGIFINGAPDATIGGDTPGQGNVISDNLEEGIEIIRATGAAILGNKVGTDVTGKVRIGNQFNGIAILGRGTEDILIGGSTAEGNLISGNEMNGIEISGSTVQNIQIFGNTIGTDIDGTMKLRNKLNGILIEGAHHNFIGDEHGGENLISGNGLMAVGGDGIQITGMTAIANKVIGNFIGTNRAGDAKLGNAGSGARIVDGAGNFIGGLDQDQGNVISGNDGDGVTIKGGTASATLVAGNAIGVSANRSTMLGNGFDGIFVNGAPGTIIGSVASAAPNVISDNGGNGIYIKGATASKTKVVKNIIGLGGDALSAMGNGGNGILIEDAPKTVVGGAAPTAGNIISGNTANGVEIKGATASKTVLARNIIGLAGDGNTSRGNGADGVLIDAATKTRVGTGVAGQGNVISGNIGNSVEVKGSGVNGTLIAGNLIGLDATGTLKRGNAAGVLLNNVSGVVVGGDTGALRNVILGSYAGVFIDDGDSNKVLGNFIGTDITGKVGIGSGSGVLLGDGTFNNNIGGSLPGQGNLISGNTGAGVLLDASGPLNTIAGNIIGLDLAGLPLPNGEGIELTFGSTQNIIGGKKPGAGNTISGNTNDGVLIAGAGTDGNEVLGNFIGTDKLNSPGLGNGANGVEILAGAQKNVIGGKQAAARNIIAVNGKDGVAIGGGSAMNKILGNIIGGGAGGNTRHGVSIEASPNNFIGKSNTITKNKMDGVIITGGAATNNVVNTNVISGNTMNGIEITGGASANIVLGNRIGVDATGAAQPNNNGVVIDGANGNFIGGGNPGDANVISGNNTVGLALANGAQGNTVVGNRIGTDAAGLVGIANGDAGISIINATQNIIGAPGARNIISANGADGIFIGGAGSTLNTIAGNLIGVIISGTSLGNMGSGISIVGASGNTIGGAAAGAGNVIAHNKHDGVTVEVGIGAAANNRIQQNSIFDNDALGIDLGNDGVTPNDPDPNDDGDTGANDLQNFPIITALADGKKADVSILLQSRPMTKYTIELFAAAPDPSGNGEGKVFLLARDVTTDGSGHATLNLVGVSAKLGASLTATATDTFTKDTSEFSGAVEVVKGPPRVSDSRLVLTGNTVTRVVLTFLGGLSPTAAEKIKNYSLTDLGADGQFGTGDDSVVKIASATYDAVHNTVTLKPKVAPTSAHFLRILASGTGIGDPTGQKLDGDFNGHFPSGDGVAGGDFIALEQRAASLAYTDSDGDNVTLSLAGGGILELFRSASGEGELLRIIDSVASVTALSGNVTQAGAGNGQTTLNAITGLDGVTNNLPAAKFIITG